MKIYATKSFKEDRYFIILKITSDYKKEKKAYLDLKDKVIGIEKFAIMIETFDEDQKILMFTPAVCWVCSVKEFCENIELHKNLSAKNYS